MSLNPPNTLSLSSTLPVLVRKGLEQVFRALDQFTLAVASQLDVLQVVRGRSAIAAAATSVRITNANVTATSDVHITPRGIDNPTKWSAVPGPGYFDVTVNSAPTAAWPFAFVVYR